MQSLVWVSSVHPLHQCSAVLQDQLPPGAYVDPEELRRLQQQKQIPPFVVSERVDVELGEWGSRPHSVLFYPSLELQPPSPSGGGKDSTWLLNVTAPIHVRYHRARSSSRHGSEAVVRISHPTVLLLCSTDLSSSCLPHTLPLPCPDREHRRQKGSVPEDMWAVKQSGEHRDGPLPTFSQQPGWRRGAARSDHRHLETPAFGEQEAGLFGGGGPALPSFGDGGHYDDVRWSDAYPQGFRELPTCYWLPVHTFSTTEGVTLAVPVGNTDQLEVVLFVTTAVTTAAMLLLLTPLLRHCQHQ